MVKFIKCSLTNDFVITNKKIRTYDFLFSVYNKEQADLGIDNVLIEVINELCNEGYKVALLGKYKENKLPFYQHENFFYELDLGITDIVTVLIKCQNMCISLNNDISRICFAFGCNNLILDGKITKKRLLTIIRKHS
jgi:hypothetical protein